MDLPADLVGKGIVYILAVVAGVAKGAHSVWRTFKDDRKVIHNSNQELNSYHPPPLVEESKESEDDEMANQLRLEQIERDLRRIEDAQKRMHGENARTNDTIKNDLGEHLDCLDEIKRKQDDIARRQEDNTRRIGEIQNDQRENRGLLQTILVALRERKDT